MRLRRLFSAWGRANSAEHTSLGVDRNAVAAEYARVLEDQLARLGVPERLVSRRVVQEGVRPDGRHGYAIYLSMAFWDSQHSPRLMLAQGFLEAGVRRAANASWVCEVSILRGLWLSTGRAAQSPEAAQVLRSLVLLAEEAATSTQPPGPARSLLQEIDPGDSAEP